MHNRPIRHCFLRPALLIFGYRCRHSSLVTASVRRNLRHFRGSRFFVLLDRKRRLRRFWFARRRWMLRLLRFLHRVNYGTMRTYSEHMADYNVRRPKRGQPAYQPTEADRNTVRYMAAGGIIQDRIAECIGTEGIDRGTLALHFKRELAIGKDAMTNRAIAKLSDAIDKGEAWAICFYLKCRAGWQEKNSLEVTGTNGGPVQLQAMRDAVLTAVADMDPAVKIQIAERLMITDGSSD